MNIDGFERELNYKDCTDCGLRIIISSKIQRGYSDHEDVYCPNCKRNLGEIRADMGFEIIRTEPLKS